MTPHDHPVSHRIHRDALDRIRLSDKPPAFQAFYDSYRSPPSDGSDPAMEEQWDALSPAEQHRTLKMWAASQAPSGAYGIIPREMYESGFPQTCRDLFGFIDSHAQWVRPGVVNPHVREFRGQQDLADALSLKSETVAKYLKLLVKHGRISITQAGRESKVIRIIHNPARGIVNPDATCPGSPRPRYKKPSAVKGTTWEAVRTTVPHETEDSGADSGQSDRQRDQAGDGQRVDSLQQGLSSTARRSDLHGAGDPCPPPDGGQANYWKATEGELLRAGPESEFIGDTDRQPVPVESVPLNDLTPYQFDLLTVRAAVQGKTAEELWDETTPKGQRAWLWEVGTADSAVTAHRPEDRPPSGTSSMPVDTPTVTVELPPAEPEPDPFGPGTCGRCSRYTERRVPPYWDPDKPISPECCAIGKPGGELDRNGWPGDEEPRPPLPWPNVYRGDAAVCCCGHFRSNHEGAGRCLRDSCRCSGFVTALHKVVAS